MTTTALIRRAALLLWWVALVLLACAPSAWPETLRVAAWSAPSGPGGESEEQTISDAAAALGKLNPDIVLVNGLRNGDVCQRLTQAQGATNYTIAVVSSFFAHGPVVEAPNVAGLEELKHTYELRISKAQGELISLQRVLADRQAALGASGKELLAQGAMDWPEVSAEKLNEYAGIAKESDKLKDQERELLRRGYKDAHPLVQTVRTLLRSYSSQRAELERSFPTLKYLGNNGDIATNTAAQDIVGHLTEIRRLRGQAAVSGTALSNLEFEASRVVSIESRIAEAERLRREQQKARTPGTEVAILARRGTFDSVTSKWDSNTAAEIPGGFTLAKVRVGGQTVAFFSATCGDATRAEDAANHLLGRIGLLKGQDEGRSLAVVVAADWGLKPGQTPGTAASAVSALKAAGFIDGLRDLPPDQRAILDSQSLGAAAPQLLIQNVAYPFSPQLICGAAVERCLPACDVEVDPTRVAAAWRARTEVQNASQRPLVRPPTVLVRWGIPAGAAALALLIGLVGLRVWTSRRQRRSTALVRVGAGRELLQSSAYTVVLTPKAGVNPVKAISAGTALPTPSLHVETPITTQTQSGAWQRRALAAEAAADHANSLLRQGLLPELARWLKQKMVRKLISDRSDLVAGQHAAARQVMAVDERLARIETQMQHQNRAYVRRIEELTAELHAAKEENRELIRARIAQVKIEMDAAREKLLKAEERQEETD